MTAFSHSLTLTYPGDVTGIVGEVKGPNLLGEFFRAVSADYDVETGKTRVKFEQLRTDSLLAAMADAESVVDGDGKIVKAA